MGNVNSIYGWKLILMPVGERIIIQLLIDVVFNNQQVKCWWIYNNLWVDTVMNLIFPIDSWKFRYLNLLVGVFSRPKIRTVATLWWYQKQVTAGHWKDFFLLLLFYILVWNFLVLYPKSFTFLFCFWMFLLTVQKKILSICEKKKKAFLFMAKHLQGHDVALTTNSSELTWSQAYRASTVAFGRRG